GGGVGGGGGRTRGGRRGRRARPALGPSGGGTLCFSPRTPLPHAPEEKPATAGATGARRRSPWLLPLVAACVTLAVVVVAYVLLFSSLLRSSGPPASDAARDRPPPEPAPRNRFAHGHHPPA